MNRKRTKIIGASLVLTLALVLLITVGVRSTSMRHFSPDGLVAHANEVDGKGVQIDGIIAEETSKWDAVKFELTFAVRDSGETAKVNVIYANKLKPDNFKDGGNVFVEGKYNAEKNLIVATKLQTKCASKYEAAESAGAPAVSKRVNEQMSK